MRSYENHISEHSDYYLYTPSSSAKKLYFYPICLGLFYYEREYCLKRDQYSSYLIMFIQSGTCKITTSSTSFFASTGDVVFINCNEPHQYESIDEWNSLWLHFDGPLAHDYYEQITQSFGNKIVPSNLEIVEHSLTKIYHTFRNSKTICEPIISKYIIALLTELLLAKTTSSRTCDKSNPLDIIISYINEHFSQPITLDDLAKMASLSPFYFTRLFTKQIGMTPHQYLIATRLNSAKFLLITTELSIKEIAFNTGFTSESSFCSTFRKWEYTTPSKYRATSAL